MVSTNKHIASKDIKTDLLFGVLYDKRMALIWKQLTNYLRTDTVQAPYHQFENFLIVK